jgi:hypothetical protein
MILKDIDRLVSIADDHANNGVISCVRNCESEDVDLRAGKGIADRRQCTRLILQKDSELLDDPGSQGISFPHDFTLPVKRENGRKKIFEYGTQECEEMTRQVTGGSFYLLTRSLPLVSPLRGYLRQSIPAPPEARYS